MQSREYLMQTRQLPGMRDPEAATLRLVASSGG